MINQLRIQNLRSIKDSGDICLRPINILLGANSSGKSTFLRSFPLFAQSVEKDLRGPIAWFDSASVDFGDYKTARNKYADEKEGITFSYEFSKMESAYSRNSLFLSIDRVSKDEFQKGYVSFELSEDNRTGTYVKSFKITLANASIEISVADSVSAADIVINGKKYEGSDKILFNHNTGIGILPTLVTLRSGDERGLLSSMMYNRILLILKEYSDKRLRNFQRLASVISYDNLDKEGFLKRIKNSGLASLSKATKNWNTQTHAFIELYGCFVLSKLNIIIKSINQELARFYHQCDYIAPLRADASRYYRIQGLQVQSVDPSGSNLLEFLASLTQKEKQSYDEFVKDILGVTISVPSESGMKSLRVNSENGDFSIADVGYGYSQILPVITKLWHTSYIVSNNSQFMSRLRFREFLKTTLLMEQPELHLHPAMQAKVADTIIKTVNTAKENHEHATLIIETHSQALINRMGRRIREGTISSEDVNVLLFSKDIDKKNTSIRQIQFTKNGQLKDWPYGFFDPAD